MTTTVAAEEWWAPARGEHFDDYVTRMNEESHVDLVCMQQEPDDLAVIAYAQRLLATKHVFSPGKYVVMVIQTLIFLAYTEAWEAE